LVSVLTIFLEGLTVVITRNASHVSTIVPAGRAERAQAGTTPRLYAIVNVKMEHP
jgi:hypothetical protein